MCCEAAEEQRARRLALEEELSLMREAYLQRERPLPVIQYIERKVYKPMPAKEIRGPVKYIDRPVERPAGVFGRLGDKVDGALRRIGFA